MRSNKERIQSNSGTNGQLSTTNRFFFRGQSIHSLLFQPLHNGHLSTMATLFCPQGGRCEEVETKVNVWTVRERKNGLL